jgi:hypothetical protein
MAMNETLYICPNCGSDDICKLSLIYKDGTTMTRGRGSARIGTFGMGSPVKVNLNSYSQTKSGALATPPMKPFAFFFRNISVGFILLMTGSIAILIITFILQQIMKLKGDIQNQIVGILSLLFLLSMAFFILKVIIIDSFRHASTYSSAINRWHNSYHCQRCDSRFVL